MSLSFSGWAGAFSLYGEANGRNAGDFAAGAAVEAIDPTINFYNPAGLALLQGSQVALSGNFIDVNAQFTGTSTFADVFDTDPPVAVNGLNGGGQAGVPSLFISRRVLRWFGWGIGVFVPFGLETDWPESAPTRYAATKTKLQIIDLSPAFAFNITSKISLGGAFDIQFGSVDFNGVAGLPQAGDVDFSVDSSTINTGTSTGFGGHVGIIYQPTPDTHFGLNYQSPVEHEFHGTSTLSGPLAGEDGTVKNRGLYSDPASMPGRITFSALHKFNEQFTLLGSFAYVQWNLLPQLVLNGVAAGPVQLVDVTVKEAFRNTVRVALGGKYQLRERILIRAGLGFDQTPVRNAEFRNLRMPDADRFALAVGGHYQPTKSIGLDVGWTHLFLNTAPINNTTELDITSVTIQGDAKGYANIVGAQLTWSVT